MAGAQTADRTAPRWGEALPALQRQGSAQVGEGLGENKPDQGQQMRRPQHSRTEGLATTGS